MKEDKYQRAVKGGGINKVAADAIGSPLSVKMGMSGADIAKNPSVQWKQEKAGYIKNRKDESSQGEKQLSPFGGPPGDAKLDKKEKKPTDNFEGVEVLKAASKGLK